MVEANNKTWTMEEINLLKEHYSYKRTKEILYLFPDRNLKRIKAKANSLGLKKEPSNNFNNYCEKCNCPIHSVSKMCRTCSAKNSWDTKRIRSIGPICNLCNGPKSDYRCNLCKKCFEENNITKCIDCKKRIYRGSTRCCRCNAKYRWQHDKNFANKVRTKLHNIVKPYSKLELTIADIISDYGFQWQFQIGNYKVDYCNQLYRTIIEIYGNYWHCNPKMYSEDFVQKESGLTAKQIWERDEIRQKEIKNLGYKFYILWEADLLSEKFNIHDFLESLNITSNVRDEYKGLPNSEILKILETKKFDYAIAMEHWKGDFNLSSVCRNANAFGAKEVFYIGKRKWDRRGALGVQHYTPIKYIKDYQALEKLKNDYTFVGVEYLENAIPIRDFKWPKKPLLIFGEEKMGLCQKIIDMCDYIVSIQMTGTIRSLNAACAAGIAMHELVSKIS